MRVFKFASIALFRCHNNGLGHKLHIIVTDGYVLVPEYHYNRVDNTTNIHNKRDACAYCRQRFNKQRECE